MVILYILDLIYKILLILIFLNFFTIAFSKDYIERLGIVVKDSYILDSPSENAKKIVRVHKNQTVVISGEMGNFFKVELNNYTSGYVNKLAVKYKNVIKDENYSYSLKKIQYDVKNILNKFDRKLSNADFYKIYGNIPQLNLNRCYIDNQSLIVEIVYSCNKTNRGINKRINSEMSSIIKKLIEVIFYKIVETSMNSYKIIVLARDHKYDNLYKDYVEYTYYPVEKMEESLKELEKTFWDNVIVTTNTKKIFEECP
jgi:hypothetical protein